MREIFALAAKDVRLLRRDTGGLVFTCFWPLMMAVLFGMMFSGGAGDRPGLPIVLVDEDQSEGSKALVSRLEAGDEVEVQRAETRSEAIDWVRLGKRAASVVLPKGFGESTKSVASPPAKIDVGFDPSRKAEAGMLQGFLVRAVMELRTKSLPASMARSPVEFEPMEISARKSGPDNSFSFTFAQGIIWGILGAAASFGASIVAERAHGTLLRLVMSPFSRTKILLGKALACFATTTTVSTLLVAIAVVVFGVRPTSVPILALAIVCSSIGFVGLMMLLAVVAKTEASASGMGWAVFLAMALFGGGMVPLFAMPSWMGTASSASPVKWAVLALEGGLWRGFSLADVAPACGILLAIGATGFAVGVKCFQWSDR
jgi:ABC-2 type transport system permease protein